MQNSGLEIGLVAGLTRPLTQLLKRAEFTVDPSDPIDVTTKKKKKKKKEKKIPTKQSIVKQPLGSEKCERQL